MHFFIIIIICPRKTNISEFIDIEKSMHIFWNWNAIMSQENLINNVNIASHFIKKSHLSQF